MPDCDVVVLGGGPGGHAAALEAAARGARVMLLESAGLGGQCVHHSCIPTQAMLSAAAPHLTGQELAIAGIVDHGDQWAIGRAAARKDALVGILARGAALSLRAARVEVVDGTGSLVGPARVAVRGADGSTSELGATAIILATGARWEAARLDGVPEARVRTLDALAALDAAPKTAAILAGGPARTAFALEYAYLLAVAGTAVTLVPSDQALMPGLDHDLDPLVRDGFEAIGVTIASPDDLAAARSAELVAGPDTRRPHTVGLGLEAIGIALTASTGGVRVDSTMATSVAGISAVGDVTGKVMLSAAATHAGRVAAVNATGGRARFSPDGIPHILHTEPPIGWVGLDETSARDAGYDVVTGLVDLGQTARAVVLGNRAGALKLVAERELGQVLGVHVVGPDAAEILAVGATAMSSELTVHDLASTVHWHPSGAEAIGEAARTCVRAIT